MKNFVSSFFTAAEYDGYKDTLIYIRNELEKGNTHLIFYDLDERFIWSIFVCMFGDYGTAPRVGWIEQVSDCIEFIDKNLKGDE